VLVAFDKFKGAISAHAACQVAAEVLGRKRPEWAVDLAPLADGGDGFCRILTEAARGREQRFRVSGSQCSGGDHELVEAELGVVEASSVPRAAREHLGWALPNAVDSGPTGLVAIVEMAAANGLARIPREQRDVWRASSRGTGELLKRAAELGVGATLLGVGGSATSDLGLGALTALGLRFEDGSGREVLPLPVNWPRLRGVKGAVDALPMLTIACDVHNPLLGPNGAAAVYGPQKGLHPADVARFDREAQRVGRLLCAHLEVDPVLMSSPGSGAAGGIAFGLAAAAGARVASGFELIWRWLDLESRVERADWVISGEGRFDRGSLSGKGPGEVVARASAKGRRAVLFAGSVERSAADAVRAQVIQVSPPAIELDRAIGDTADHLRAAVERWLDTLI
jgi:glycerate kinase